VILVSAVLVLVALVLLLYGVIASDGVFEIWLSIGASVAAGLLLVWGIVQQRRRLAAVSPASTEPAPANTETGPATPENAEPTTDVAAPPQAEETAQERVAAHDSAPVMAVSEESEPPPGPAIVPVGGADTPEPIPAPDQPQPPVDVAPPSDLPSSGESPPDVVDAPAPVPVESSRVLVLVGRPRYHVPGCRFLDGRDDIEVLRLDDARAQGYTPCSVCRA
jgi:hypothetical protein